MTLEQYKKFRQERHDLEERARMIASRIEGRRVENVSLSMDEDTVDFEFYAHSNNYHGAFPVAWLFAADWESLWQADKARRASEAEEAKQRAEAERRTTTERAERATYERLKAKYEVEVSSAVEPK